MDAPFQPFKWLEPRFHPTPFILGDLEQDLVGLALHLGDCSGCYLDLDESACVWSAKIE